MFSAAGRARGGSAAILVAGGRAGRLGGATKPLLRVHGHTLLDHAVAAAGDLGCTPVIAVGSELPTDPTLSSKPHWVREQPPFGGPAAAIVTGLDAVPSGPEWTLVLATDLPRARAAVALLGDALALLPGDADGVCLADERSRPQWLIGLYRTQSLRDAAAGVPLRGQDAPVRDLMTDLAITVITDPADLGRDIDTWDDLRREEQ